MILFASGVQKKNCFPFELSLFSDLIDRCVIIISIKQDYLQSFCISRKCILSMFRYLYWQNKTVFSVWVNCNNPAVVSPVMYSMTRSWVCEALSCFSDQVSCTRAVESFRWREAFRKMESITSKSDPRSCRSTAPRCRALSPKSTWPCAAARPTITPRCTDTGTDTPSVTNHCNNDCLMFLKVSSAHQGCIYLIKNTVKIVKYYYNVK